MEKSMLFVPHQSTHENSSMVSGYLGQKHLTNNMDAVVKTVKIRRELIVHALLESGCARNASQITFILSFQAIAAHTEFSKNKKSKVAGLCAQI